MKDDMYDKRRTHKDNDEDNNDEDNNDDDN